MTRDELLQAAVEHVLDHGLADLSLRRLADEIGTSHRMLIYHFGSKEGLVTEVVGELDRRLFQRAWPAAAARPDQPQEASRLVWKEVSAPRHRDEWILQIEVLVAAMRHHPGTAGLAERFHDWTHASAAQAGWLEGDAFRQSRLLAAVVRGLLIDQLVTGDRKGVNEAFERFLELAALDPRLPVTDPRT